MPQGGRGRRGCPPRRGWVPFLGTPRAPAHLEAAADALLEDDWAPHDNLEAYQVADASEMLTVLQTRTHRYTRNHKMIGDTQINGRGVVLLDQPLGRAENAYVLLDHLASTRGIPSTVDGFDDPRLTRLISHLKPHEQRICYAKAHADTWAEAAADAGFGPKDGEAVRRKCKTLTHELARRDHARIDTV